MDKDIFLHDIMPHECASVISVGTCGDIKKRFTDLGLIEGSKIKCVGVSPLGDPKAYLIQGAVIAIRNKDCKDITVKRI